jgi:hypothetical protein
MITEFVGWAAATILLATIGPNVFTMAQPQLPQRVYIGNWRTPWSQLRLFRTTAEERAVRLNPSLGSIQWVPPPTGCRIDGPYFAKAEANN